MQAQYWWWLATLGLGIVEMLTGTFYLLVLAIGCAAAGVAALVGLNTIGQLLVAAALTLVGWALLRRWHPARSRRVAATADRDVLLDIGERVSVAAWDAAGRTEVSYRGARWVAELDPAVKATLGVPAPGEYEIRGVVGNRLLVAPPAA